jgi:hypothetical protein
MVMDMRASRLLYLDGAGRDECRRGEAGRRLGSDRADAGR